MPRIRPIALAALLCLWAGLAGAAIGTPTQLGVGTATNGNISITTGADAPPGSLIIVVASATNTHALSGVADNAGNCASAYSAAANSTQSGAVTLGVYYCLTTIDLPSGGVISVTLNSSHNMSATAFAVTTGIAASPLDKSGTIQTATSGTSATSTSTGALSQAVEIVVGVLALDGGTSGGFTPGGSFSSIGGELANSKGAYVAYQIVNSTSSVAWAPSWSGSTDWQSSVYSFKGAAASATKDNLLLGIGF